MSSEQAKRRALARQCQRFVSGPIPSSPADELAALSTWCRENDVHSDMYGVGEHMRAFEADIAKRLGKAAGLFVPSGTAAQQIALRIWCERAGLCSVAFHQTCHLELHEERGYSHLHGLVATLIGEPDRPILARDIAGLREAPAAVVVELPMREIGGQLPTWDQLQALGQAALARGIRLHMDGARLWECRGWFDNREYSDICRGFDSVYVSLYKGIGAIAGAVLAGPEDFIAEARVWLRRHGGNLVQSYPFVFSAQMKLERNLAEIPAWLERARALAVELETLPFIRIRPNPPQVNLFHIYFERDADALLSARDQLAREERIWLFGGLRPCEVPGFCATEIYIGAGAMALSIAEVVESFARLGELAAR